MDPDLVAKRGRGGGKASRESDSIHWKNSSLSFRKQSDPCGSDETVIFSHVSLPMCLIYLNVIAQSSSASIWSDSKSTRPRKNLV